jgi:nucleoside-diphosphate-sugar epimerase
MILVTGATGLVGSQLLLQLTERQKKVRAIKRSTSSMKLVEKVFGLAGQSASLKKVEWVEADLLDIFSLDEALKKVHEVYHCGAMVSFHPSLRRQMLRVNIEGTANLVNASLDAGVQKFCHVSSVAALGRSEEDQHVDEHSIWKHSKRNSVYAKSKYGAEKEVWRGMAEGLNAVIVNPSIIFGVGNWNGGSTEMIREVWKGLRFYTRGANSFVDVRDVARAMIELMDNNHFDERFIVTSESLPYRQVFNWIAEFLGKKPPNILVLPVMGEIAWRFYAIKGLITGRKPAITRETVRNASKRYYYSADKIKHKIGIEFIPVKQSLADCCAVFLSDVSKT